MKLNEKTVNKLEEAFSIGADIPAACYFANISKQTYYNWINDNKELKEEFDRLREKPVMRAYRTVSDDLNKSETAKWFLERKRRNEFAPRQEVTGAGGEPLILPSEIINKHDLTRGTKDNSEGQA